MGKRTPDASVVQAVFALELVQQLGRHLQLKPHRPSYPAPAHVPK